jgi:hypothetical protein
MLYICTRHETHFLVYMIFSIITYALVEIFGDVHGLAC